MRTFVYNTDANYNKLRSSLNDMHCHAYVINLPNSFNKPKCKIGLSIYHGFFRLEITNGLICSHKKASLMLKDWLKRGELLFLDFNDLKNFLKSLTYLYR